MTPREVRDLRISRGHTQAVAASVVGVTMQTWYRWEAGEYPPSAALVELYRLKTAGETVHEAPLDNSKRGV